MDTIFAVSSGAAPAAIAVLRISGPAAFAAAEALAGAMPAPRQASLRRLRDPVDGILLDRALLLTFPAPATATGEDIAELHLHGGRAVVAAVEQAIGVMPGLRPAEAGEFTRRALANGRIDLTEAEGLGDLLAAETETQRRTAMVAAEGGIRALVENWSSRMLDLAARVEAQLDFSDEDDVSVEDSAVISRTAADLARDIATAVASPPVERLRDGISVVLAGPRNSGKSTLLNALAEREAAIVSPVAGTTRDRIDVPVRRNGVAYVLSDTAGLVATTEDPVEAIGIERAQAAIAAADILLWLGDDPPPRADAIWVHSRADLANRRILPPGRAVAVAAIRSLGLPELWLLAEQSAAKLLPRLDEIALNARQRHLAAECAAALAMSAGTSDILIVAEQLRLGRSALDRITGHTDTEAMLDALFGRFCIGK